MKEINIPFVWMDVDSIMHKQLNIFDELAKDCDLAFAFPKVPSKEDPSMALPKASPIFINNTAAAISFLWEWVEASEQILKTDVPVFDHEILVNLFITKLQKIRIGCLPGGYCIWPGTEFVGEKYITMGLADGESKENTLKKLGFDDNMIKYQSVGNKFIEMI
jgi:hypothetical protein